MKKILMVILDGFGIRDDEAGNAIKSANMQNFENLWSEYPHSKLEASGKFVGLSDGQFGNSEVGHLTIGAGRLVRQNEIVVNDFLDVDYETNEIFKELSLQTEKTFHIMGLCSDGNVHASVDHFVKMHELLIKQGITRIYFHLITDGRDTDTKSALKYIDMINQSIEKHNNGKIATICGRYYAMDRDNNYDRVKLYYDLIVNGEGNSSLNLERTFDSNYERNVTDEFIKPIILDNEGTIKNGDILIWMNYRADRAKQILKTFTDLEFSEFKTKKMDDLSIYSFLPVDDKIKTINFNPNEDVKNSLGMYLADLGLDQTRLSESEKFPHVTYFFDGGYNGKIENCKKYEVPSPDVATYDLKPEMSAVAVTKKLCKILEEDDDFVLVNFANPDMVGHTGNYEATVEACMALDVCIGKILEVAENNFYKVIILSDHGNADIMYDLEGNVCTTHTTSKVPFIIVDKNVELKDHGDLTMVAPTILTYMDIAVPKEMQDTKILLK